MSLKSTSDCLSLLVYFPFSQEQQLDSINTARIDPKTAQQHMHSLYQRPRRFITTLNAEQKKKRKKKLHAIISLCTFKLTHTDTS